MENSMFLIKNLLLIAFSKIIGVQNQLPIRFDTALKSELLLQFVTFCTVLSLFLSLSLSLSFLGGREKRTITLSYRRGQILIHPLKCSMILKVINPPKHTRISNPKNIVMVLIQFI